jgi:hypothetical protein
MIFSSGNAPNVVGVCGKNVFAEVVAANLNNN